MLKMAEKKTYMEVILENKIEWEDVPEVAEQTEEEKLAEYLMNEFPGVETFILPPQPSEDIPPVKEKTPTKNNDNTFGSWGEFLDEEEIVEYIDFKKKKFYTVKMLDTPSILYIHFFKDGGNTKRGICSNSQDCEYCKKDIQLRSKTKRTAKLKF